MHLIAAIVVSVMLVLSLGVVAYTPTSSADGLPAVTSSKSSHINSANVNINHKYADNPTSRQYNEAAAINHRQSTTITTYSPTARRVSKITSSMPATVTTATTNQPTKTKTSTTKITTTNNQPQHLEAAFVYRADLPPITDDIIQNSSNSSYIKDSNHSANANNNNNNHFNDKTYKLNNESDAGKKIIGSSKVTTVSVVLNGDEPQFTNALGHKVPKPQPSIQVASPIDLLNPDRYEFYTFDENGDLVKRLMTMQEIQSIVANGDGEGPSYIHSSTVAQEPDPENKVQDIVKTVQNVLNKEVASNKNVSQTDKKPILDTPDVSGSWSMILPAIFGNTGDDIFPKQKPHQIVMTPESEILETSSTTVKPNNKPKPKPSYKRKTTLSATTTSTKVTPQVVQEELDPNESVYTGLQQYQSMAANMENFDNYAQFNIHPIYQNQPGNNQQQQIIDSEIIMLEEGANYKPTAPPIRRKKPTFSTVTATTSKRTQTTKNKVKKKPNTTTTPIPNSVNEKTTNLLSNNFDSTSITNTPLTKATRKPINQVILHHQENLAEKPQIMEIELVKRPTVTSTSHKQTTIISVIKRKKKPTQQPATTSKTSTTLASITTKEEIEDNSDKVATVEEDINNLQLQSSNQQPHFVPHILHGFFKPKPTTENPTTITEPTTTTVVYAPVPTTTHTLPPSSMNGTSLVVQEFPGLSSTQKNPLKSELASTVNSIAELPNYTASDSGSIDTNVYPNNEESAEDIQDLHTLESFDKIMQSLTQSLPFVNKFNDYSSIKPIKYDSAETMDQLEDMADKRKKPINRPLIETSSTKIPLNKTPEQSMNMEFSTVRPFTVNEEGSTLPTIYNEEEGFTVYPDKYETTTQNESEDSSVVVITARPQFISGLNKKEENEFSYTTKADDSEVEISDLPSSKPFNYVETSTLQTTDYETTKRSTDHLTDHTKTVTKESQPATLNYDKDTTNVGHDYTTAYTSSDIKSEDTTIDYSVTNAKEENVMVVDLVPHLNMELLKPIDHITMSDFQTQAATVASTLLDGLHTLPADILNTTDDNKNDYQLVTDAIEQIANYDSQPSYDYNRFSSLVQLNNSFLSESLKKISKLPDLLHSYHSKNNSKEDEDRVEEEFIHRDNLTINIDKKNNIEVTSTTDALEEESENNSLKHKQSLKTNIEEDISTEKGDNQFKDKTAMGFEEEIVEKEDKAVTSTINEESSIEFEEVPLFTQETSTEEDGKDSLTTISVTKDHPSETYSLTEKPTTALDSVEKENSALNLSTPLYLELDNLHDREALFESNNSQDPLMTEDNQKQFFEDNGVFNKKEDKEQSFTNENDSETTTEYAMRIKHEEDLLDKVVTESDFTKNPEILLEKETLSSLPDTDQTPTTEDEEILKNTTFDTETSASYSQSLYENLEQVNESKVEVTSKVKSDSNKMETTTESFTIKEETSEALNSMISEEQHIKHIFEGDPYVKLGETTQKSFATEQAVTVHSSTTPTTTTAYSKVTKKSDNIRPLDTVKPVSYFNKQSSYSLYQDSWDSWNKKREPLAAVQTSNSKHSVATPQQSRPMHRPPQLNNLMASSTQATRPPVKLEPSPTYSKGLEASLFHMDKDVLDFTELCNELAFSYWKAITSEKISTARSLIISPFALTSMLSMVFLGARGSTSGEMNDMLRLDDMVTFNPHLIFKNITDSVERSKDRNIATTAFVRELFSDRSNGKILQFYKERAQQIYSGHVEEVNFHVVNDIIRRRTNLLVKRHTKGKVFEYLRTNSIWLNGPLATLTANLYQTDCSSGSIQERDGEMFFQVHPSIRQRRLIPIPAIVFRSGFTAGYESTLDATIVAFGNTENTVSVLYVMPGHQYSASPADNLIRLEKDLMETAISKGAWSKLLTSLMDRPGLEVQLPRFSHRSFINATAGLQNLGLSGLFRSDYADLGGLTGSLKRDIYLSDMIQINTFSTCGEEKIADHHHIEMYPAPPLRKRNKNVETLDLRNDDDDDADVADDNTEPIVDFGSLVQDPALGRGFYDDLLNPKYLELPLPLRPRQARVPDAPRLRFDKPFLYFVRHNPTGMLLFMGRFNPRLLP